MFRRRRATAPHEMRFPRIRGDVPYKNLLLALAGRFSPHTRGCSLQLNTWEHPRTVFPAYAGMFRV